MASHELRTTALDVDFSKEVSFAADDQDLKTNPMGKAFLQTTGGSECLAEHAIQQIAALHSL